MLDSHPKKKLYATLSPPLSPVPFIDHRLQALLAESNTEKTTANALFTTAQYSEAISTYDRALASCPNYLDYEVAVLQSNISACYLKLEEWKEAVESATRSLDRLEIIDPLPKSKDEKNTSGVGKNGKSTTSEGADDAVVELRSDDDDVSAALEKLKLSDERKADVQKIRAKALLRRARGRIELGGWSNLAGAEEDYKQLASMKNLPLSDQKVVKAALRDLPPRVNAAREKEMGEMMGKLKELGNGILKPFGLSTDNFKMVKDEKTGGYSMNFQK